MLVTKSVVSDSTKTKENYPSEKSNLKPGIFQWTRHFSMSDALKKQKNGQEQCLVYVNSNSLL